MRKNKISDIIYIIVMLSLLAFVYSCEKKEPKVQISPSDLMEKIGEKFEIHGTEPQESDMTGLYSDDKNKHVDYLSKIEKYAIIQANKNSVGEIGIFKLYDKINAQYVKEMAQARILKMQQQNKSDANLSKISNDAEARTYGNYVYYVSHPKKDEIFEIIENSLRGA